MGTNIFYTRIFRHKCSSIIIARDQHKVFQWIFPF